jgi:hypothetical protein
MDGDMLISEAAHRFSVSSQFLRLLAWEGTIPYLLFDKENRGAEERTWEQERV